MALWEPLWLSFAKACFFVAAVFVLDGSAVVIRCRQFSQGS
jgi:hypothetical protein